MPLSKQEKDYQKHLESQGYTGATHAELDSLNRVETDSMTTDELWELRKEREEIGLPFDKIEAALDQRAK